MCTPCAARPPCLPLVQLHSADAAAQGGPVTAASERPAAAPGWASPWPAVVRTQPAAGGSGWASPWKRRRAQPAARRNVLSSRSSGFQQQPSGSTRGEGWHLLHGPQVERLGCWHKGGRAGVVARREGCRRQLRRHRSALLCEVHEVQAGHELLLGQERLVSGDDLPHVLQGLPREPPLHEGPETVASLQTCMTYVPAAVLPAEGVCLIASGRQLCQSAAVGEQACLDHAVSVTVKLAENLQVVLQRMLLQR